MQLASYWDIIGDDILKKRAFCHKTLIT